MAKEQIELLSHSIFYESRAIGYVTFSLIEMFLSKERDEFSNFVFR